MINKQRGSTLLVALVMLVLLTLMAISAMNATTSSIQVVGNAQFLEEAAAAGQRAIETVISTNAFKTVPPGASAPPVPADQYVDVNGDGVNDYKVTFAPANCMSYTAVNRTQANLPDDCYGSGAPTCFWAIWDLTAVVTDLHGSGATATVHQGVRTITGLTAQANSCS